MLRFGGLVVVPFLDYSLPLLLGVALTLVPLGGGGNQPWSACLRQALLTAGLVGGLLRAQIISPMRPGRPTGIEIPLLFFGGVCLVSWLTSGYELSSRLEMVDILLFGGLLYILGNFPGRRELGLLIAFTVAAGFGYSLFALYQKIALGQSRCASTFFNPNFAASFFLGALGYALGLVKDVRGDDLRRWLYLGAVTILVSGIWCTGSRSAMAGLVLVGSVFAWAVSRRARLALGAGALLLVALILLPNPARDRLSKGVTKDPYAFDRIKIWEQALNIIRDNPLTGVGIGNFEYSTQAYRFPLDREIGRFGRVYRDAHNSYLQVAAEIGLPGAALLLVAIFILFRRIGILLSEVTKRRGVNLGTEAKLRSNLPPGSYRNSKGGDLPHGTRVEPVVSKGHLIGALLALIGVMSQAFFHEIVDSPPSVFLAVLASGIVSCYWRVHLTGENSALQENPASLGNPPRFSKAIFVLGAFFLAFVFWPHFSLRVFLAEQFFKKAEEVLQLRGVEAAEKLVRDAIRLNPSQAYFHKTLGDLLMERYERERDLSLVREAEEEFETATSLNRLDPHLVFHLGQFYRYAHMRGIGGKELQEASLAAYRKAVHMSPFNVHYLARLALEELRSGNVQEAMAAAKKTIELEPLFLSGHYLMALVAMVSGDAGAAAEWKQRMTLARERHGSHVPASQYEKLLGLEPREYFLGEDLPILSEQSVSVAFPTAVYN